MPGPIGTTYNFDSYVTATPPTNVLPAPPKQINAGDKKSGPPKPMNLGGSTGSNHGNRDTYWE